jgi:hypothetical protein
MNNINTNEIKGKMRYSKAAKILKKGFALI